MFDSWTLSLEHLRTSLEKTLTEYPQWAGQIYLLPHESHPSGKPRVGRTAISYGDGSDPGVELIVATCECSIASLVPSIAERAMRVQALDLTSLPSHKLLPSTQMALYDMQDHAGLPGVAIQLTTFSCGGAVLALKIRHLLADAQSMMTFVQGWTATSRALLRGDPLPILSPVFDPSLLDCAASGDTDATEPDPELVKNARQLLLRRYDWWASQEGCPRPMLPSTQPPPELGESFVIEPAGEAMPWHEWNLAKPVSHYLIHLTKTEVDQLWKAASVPPTPAAAPVQVSKMEALLAYMWALINRARGLKEDEQPVHLDLTFGLRPRVSPPLPDTFLGSPIMLALVSASGKEVSASDTTTSTTASIDSNQSFSLFHTASRIHSVLSEFDASAIGAVLHDTAHTISPQRIWQAFLGHRNVLFTSWAHMDVYGVDFGMGARPRYVEPIMPSCDGLLQIMEAGSTKQIGEKRGHWCEEGVDVCVYLEQGAMERLLRLRESWVPVSES